MIPTVRAKISDAVEKLEEQLVSEIRSSSHTNIDQTKESNEEAGGEAPTAEVTKAKEAIANAKKALRESA